MGSSEVRDRSKTRRRMDDEANASNDDASYDRRKERSDRGDKRDHRRDRDNRDSDRRRRTRSPDLRRRRSRERDRDDEDSRRSRAHRDERRSSRDRDRDRDRRRGDSEDRHKSRRRRGSRDGHDSRRSGRRDEADREEGPSKAIEPFKRRGPLPSQGDSFAMVEAGGDPDQAKPKEQPNYGNSGSLAAASNSVVQADGTSIVLKYSEPPEARKPSPKDEWKLFVFKDGNIVDTIDLSLRSCWLVGREMRVVDLPAEHESISKQHAVLQFRYVEKRNQFGDKIGKVKPYLIDLQSANGTMLNKDKVPDSRYLELRDKDMVQFGLSTREYVLIHPK